MKKQRFVLSGLFGVLMAIAGPQANAVLIDFGSALPGAPTGADVILTNQLTSLGVDFSTTDSRGIVWHGPAGTGAFPFVISAGGVCISAVTCGNQPIRVDINTAITGAFSSVSITGFDGGGDFDTMRMRAFDSANMLLDMVTITDIYTTPGLVSTVSSASLIAYVTFEVTGTTGGLTAQHGLFFDNLCIGSCEPAQVPEPASILLLGSGLLVALALGRRKRLRIVKL